VSTAVSVLFSETEVINFVYSFTPFRSQRPDAHDTDGKFINLTAP
jgi:hypothetical protein